MLNRDVPGNFCIDLNKISPTCMHLSSASAYSVFVMTTVQCSKAGEKKRPFSCKGFIWNTLDKYLCPPQDSAFASFISLHLKEDMHMSFCLCNKNPCLCKTCPPFLAFWQNGIYPARIFIYCFAVLQSNLLLFLIKRKWIPSILECHSMYL